MRMQALTILGVGLLLAADAPKDDATKKDLEKIQGTWVAVSAEEDGNPLPADAVKTMKLVIKDNQYTMTAGNETEKGTFKFDASKTPRTLDVTPSDGPNKGKTMLGIYEIDGDMHKSCFAAPGKDRPKEFSAKKGSGQILIVLKREKP